MYKMEFGSSHYRTIEEGNEREWLISNGIGGYGGHTIIGGGNRMYHGYLVASFRPPVERKLVLTRTQESIKIGDRHHDLTCQTYMNWQKEGHKYLSKFSYNGLPHYHYQIEDVLIHKTIVMERKKNTVAICYEIEGGCDDASLEITPLFNYRDPGHVSCLRDLDFSVEVEPNLLTLVPKVDRDKTIRFYTSVGAFFDRSSLPMNMTTPNYVYEENHFYKYENDNGFTGVDSHYTPYSILVPVPKNEKIRFYQICTVEEGPLPDGFDLLGEAYAYQEALLKKADVKDDLQAWLTLAADHFIVDRASTGLKTVLAGYPWFNDWGRDTMIALHGLTLTTNRYEDAKAILASFAAYVRDGLIPNNFPDTDTEPGYNTVDGSLWCFYAAHQYLEATGDKDFIQKVLYDKLKDIIEAYRKGTHFAIGMDPQDGLIVAGDGSLQLTWMDVKIGDWVVTPRNGKPVEINALWYNALKVMGHLARSFKEDDQAYEALAEQVAKSFRDKFWYEEEDCLYDVIEKHEDHIRCNQIWAVSLPYSILDQGQAMKVVQKVYKELYTPYGLRSLSPKDQAFVSTYIGKLYDRDASYHMGTTWTYPIGAFISAYIKVYGREEKTMIRAREMCDLFMDHLKDGCVGGVAEIFDGLFPAKGRGCYTQAWSVSEVLRVYVEEVMPFFDK